MRPLLYAAVFSAFALIAAVTVLAGPHGKIAAAMTPLPDARVATFQK
jgi:hypothetical protein